MNTKVVWLSNLTSKHHKHEKMQTKNRVEGFNLVLNFVHYLMSITMDHGITLKENDRHLRDEQLESYHSKDLIVLNFPVIKCCPKQFLEKVEHY